jgi:predicted PhzF superfamily epimerase YddE/YHI9
VLRVFCAPDDSGGNPLGVFLDGAEVPDAERQAVAHELGFAETVFVDDADRGEIRIFTPAIELPFAGHPSVGVAWLLRREVGARAVLRPPAGEVPARHDGGMTFIAARPEWAPQLEYVQLGSAAEVEAVQGTEVAGETYAWAWIDEAAGEVRARCFVQNLGIDEDEATGAAAIVLCSRLGRPITIRQGRGSVLTAAPRGNGTVEVGGRVALDERREYELP